MSGHKKKSQKFYNARERRSHGESSNEESPQKPLPVNCCEDREEGELEDSPVKKMNIGSVEPTRSDSWRSQPLPNLENIALGGNMPSNDVRKQQNRTSFGFFNAPVAGPSRPKNNRRSAQPNLSGNGSWRDSNEEGKLSQESRAESKAMLKEFHNSNVPYIDSHCHTDFIFPHMQRVLYNEEHNGLNTWVDKFPDAFPKTFSGLIANFIKPDLFVHTKETENEYDTEWISREIGSSELYLGTTWGCHPHHAQKWGRMAVFWTTLEHILSNKQKWKVLAVGECGIDLHRCESDLEIQKTVFERHVSLAFKFNYPLVIHCRNGAKGSCEDECLEILKKQMEANHPNLSIHRHCYTENWETAKKWLRQCPGVHFGFTPGILNFRENQIEAVRLIPLDRIILETDAPFFKPKSFEGIGPQKASLPGMSIATAFRIAEIKELSVDEVLRATYNNTRRLYQIPVY